MKHSKGLLCSFKERILTCSCGPAYPGLLLPEAAFFFLPPTAPLYTTAEEEVPIRHHLIRSDLRGGQVKDDFFGELSMHI